MSKTMRKSVIASFFMLSMVGSLLIILSLALHFGLDIEYKTDDTSLASAFMWTFGLSNMERFAVYALIFLLIFFLLIDSVFVVWFLCTVKMENFPLVLTNSYHGFNNDIECPLLSLENTPKTPKVQFKNEKAQQGSSSARRELYKELKEELNKKKCNKITVTAEVHRNPDEKQTTATPKSYIKVPNNARSVGTPEMIQKIIGQEIDAIVKDESYVDTSEHRAVKYVFIKPWNERGDKSSLAEAIVYSGSKECFF